MFALYITHPQVQIDPATPVPNWGLSSMGVERAAQASRLPWAGTLTRIISSNETKAIETASILAGDRITVEVVPSMHENDRSATGFLPPDQFEKAADRFFANPEESFCGWERACDAQTRIVSAVLAILRTHDPKKPIAFVGHGGVGTLLKCHLAATGISRSQDQVGGGGNLYAFSLADYALACDWTPIEHWQGYPDHDST